MGTITSLQKEITFTSSLIRKLYSDFSCPLSLHHIAAQLLAISQWDFISINYSTTISVDITIFYITRQYRKSTQDLAWDYYQYPPDL